MHSGVGLFHEARRGEVLYINSVKLVSPLLAGVFLERAVPYPRSARNAHPVWQIQYLSKCLRDTALSHHGVVCGFGAVAGG